MHLIPTFVTCWNNCAAEIGIKCFYLFNININVSICLILSMYLWWSLCLVFTGMPGERYHRQLRPLVLYLCYVFRALINSLVDFV